jgi:3-oxoacyl-[acyl-carrier-protein] synthase-1
VLATSGSTGTPKGALLSPAALRASVEATHARLGGPGHWLLALPAWHIAGLMVLLRAVLAETAPSVLDVSGGFDPARLPAVVEAMGSGRKYTSLVANQLIKALAQPAAREALTEFDAVLVGGADSLCKLTVNGFAALESTSIGICNPMSRNRNGINIGEGAALFLMTRDSADIEFIGAGESSDAHHMSAPHPEGVGAEAAMRAALADARLDPADVDYLNMHATATVKNDEMEAKAMHRVFGSDVPASGTKPMTGHLLGAAGATELAFCWLALQADRLPPHVWDGEVDPGLPSFMPVGQGGTFRRQSRRLCMSNSFAFGGSNATLLIGDRR